VNHSWLSSVSEHAYSVVEVRGDHAELVTELTALHGDPVTFEDGPLRWISESDNARIEVWRADQLDRVVNDLDLAHSIPLGYAQCEAPSAPSATLLVWSMQSDGGALWDLPVTDQQRVRRPIRIALRHVAGGEEASATELLVARLLPNPVETFAQLFGDEQAEGLVSGYAEFSSFMGTAEALSELQDAQSRELTRVTAVSVRESAAPGNWAQELVSQLVGEVDLYRIRLVAPANRADEVTGFFDLGFAVVIDERVYLLGDLRPLRR